MTRTVTQLVLRDCSTCGEQRAFEAVVCAESHGADCPELVCIDCGEAVFVGVFEFEAAAGAEIETAIAAAA